MLEHGLSAFGAFDDAALRDECSRVSDVADRVQKLANITSETEENPAPRHMQVGEETGTVQRRANRLRGLLSFHTVTWHYYRLALVYCHGQHCSRLPPDIQHIGFRKLQMIDGAELTKDLNTPGNRLEKLYGEREGQMSIRINDRFRFKNGHATDVEIDDYH